MSMLMSSVIKNDHQEVYTKYHQLWTLSAFDAAKDKAQRKALVTDLIKLMTVHSNVETEVIYPILNHLPKHGKQAATKAQAEHEEVELLLKQLQDMDVDAPHFASTLKKALSMFKLHGDDEEKNLLPEIDQHLQAQGGDVMQRTVAEYERAKKHVGHVPHPAISHPGQGKEVAEGLLKAAEDAARQTPESAHVFNATTQGTAK